MDAHLWLDEARALDELIVEEIICLDSDGESSQDDDIGVNDDDEEEDDHVAPQDVNDAVEEDVPVVDDGVVDPHPLGPTQEDAAQQRFETTKRLFNRGNGQVR